MRLAGGTLAAHWLQVSGSSAYAYDVRLAFSTDEGRTWSAPTSPHHDGTPTEHGFASLFQAPGAGLGLVWLDGRNMKEMKPGDHEMSGAMGLRAAVFDPNGRQLSETVLDDRVCECCPTAAAETSQGPIVAYRDRSPTEIRDIYVARLVDELVLTSPALPIPRRRAAVSPAAVARFAPFVTSWTGTLALQGLYRRADAETIRRRTAEHMVAAHLETARAWNAVEYIALDASDRRPSSGLQHHLQRSVHERDAAAPSAPHGNGEIVMLVDDEEPLVVLGEEMLAAVGYEPVGFHSGRAALAAFRAEPRRFDLVLTDEIMPEITGTELASALHAMRPELPIVLMTGYAGDIRPHQLQAVGINACQRFDQRRLTVIDVPGRADDDGAHLCSIVEACAPPVKSPARGRFRPSAFLPRRPEKPGIDLLPHARIAQRFVMPGFGNEQQLLRSVQGREYAPRVIRRRVDVVVADSYPGTSEAIPEDLHADVVFVRVADEFVVTPKSPLVVDDRLEPPKSTTSSRPTPPCCPTTPGARSAAPGRRPRPSRARSGRLRASRGRTPKRTTTSAACCTTWGRATAPSRSSAPPGSCGDESLTQKHDGARRPLGAPRRFALYFCPIFFRIRWSRSRISGATGTPRRIASTVCATSG